MFHITWFITLCFISRDLLQISRHASCLVQKCLRFFFVASCCVALQLSDSFCWLLEMKNRSFWDCILFTYAAFYVWAVRVFEDFLSNSETLKIYRVIRKRWNVCHVDICSIVVFGTICLDHCSEVSVASKGTPGDAKCVTKIPGGRKIRKFRGDNIAATSCLLYTSPSPRD